MIRGKLRYEARVGTSNALVFLAQRSTPAQVARTLGMTMGALSETRPDPDELWVRE
jgi:hypothetical protein